MSHESVAIWRANIESQSAEFAAGTSPEATISKMTEIWDPEVELDASDDPVLDLNARRREARGHACRPADARALDRHRDVLR
jgi:hypothetical protein